MARNSKATMASNLLRLPQKEKVVMKRFGWILAVLMLASPAWAAKKVTVQQLKDMLVSMQQSHKTDDEVASELKQVELTEEMTVSTKNSLAGLLPVVNGTAGLRSSSRSTCWRRAAPRWLRGRRPAATAALDAAAQKACWTRPRLRQDLCSTAPPDRQQEHHTLPGQC